MVEETGASAPAAKPKRKIGNYLLDRRFQLKYTLLLSCTCAVLMGAMAGLLFMQMRDSEGRLSREMALAHSGMETEMRASSDMVRHEMDVSAQQLITRQLPCVAPACPPCASREADITTQSSGSACDVDTCRPLCEALGTVPARTAAVPGRTAPPPPPDPPASASAEVPGVPPDAPAEPAVAAEPPPPPPPPPPPAAVGDDDAEQRRQRELIRKIEETVRAETAERAASMEAETNGRLEVLDRSTQERLGSLRDANHRGLMVIIAVVAGILVVLVLTGIVITHKVAGPIYKMKMLMGRIDGDHLTLAGSLRRGDELRDLFEELSGMLDRLRGHQQAEIDALHELVERLRAADDGVKRDEVVAAIEAFERRMAGAIEK